MIRRVLFEGYNLTLASGTGIATYARHLATAARDGGYATEVLVGTNRAISARDPQLAEVVLFDGPRHTNLIHKGYIEFRRLAGAPFGLVPGILDGINGTVIDRRGVLDGFDRIHAVPHLIDVERLHFLRHGSRLRLRVANPPAIFHATRPAPLVVPGAANVYTIHDIVPLRLPATTADDKAYFVGMLRELVARAEHIVTVSEFSRQDIIAFTGMAPDRITNTYQTVAFPPELTARSEAEVARSLEEKHGLGFKDYFLFVGAIEPKKNLSRLIDAYAASGAKRPLVIAGGLGWMYEADVERINSERFLTYLMKDGTLVPQRRVRRLSYLPLGDVVDLIRGARALLYPSIYEGFGLPAAEAMLLGTAVMTSNVASLPEITGGAAVHVDPYDIEEIAAAIRRLDADDDLVRELVVKGRARSEVFTHANHVQRLRSIYGRFAS